MLLQKSDFVQFIIVKKELVTTVALFRVLLHVECVFSNLAVAYC